MKKTLADMQAAVAREATMPRQKGPNPFTGTPTSTSNGMGSPIGRAPMGMQPKLDALKAQAVKGMPTGMFYRPPVIANKARGTMSSANRAAMGGMY